MCENGNYNEVILKFVMELAWCYSTRMLSYVTYFTVLWVTCLWPISMPFSLHVSSYSTPHITWNSPSQFQVPCFLSISCLSRTQFVMSSAVSDLNAGCRAVTSSCTLLLTLLLFTATATHLHPSGCQYFYHYTHMLPLGSCIACSSWTDYTLEWRRHDHQKRQEPSISECSATYRRFESSQFILFYDCHYVVCCRRNGSMIWWTYQIS
jgi:hypothetical protein